MKLLQQVGILFGLCWLCQCLERVLPFAFPASVLAMVVLLVLLAGGVCRVERVQSIADFLLKNLPFFFIPVSVSIMEYADVIFSNAAAFFTVCAVSTVITFAATAWAVRLTLRWMERRGKA